MASGDVRQQRGKEMEMKEEGCDYTQSKVVKGLKS